jgi:hypothetical protein
MQSNVRYYIVKSDDQPVVRSVAVERPVMADVAGPVAESARPEPKLSVTNRLRLALRRRREEEATRA